MSDESTTPTGAESTAVESTAEENKRKMREALELKKGRRGEDHIDNDPKQPQAHGPADTKRSTFRRKTG